MSFLLSVKFLEKDACCDDAFPVCYRPERTYRPCGRVRLSLLVFLRLRRQGKAVGASLPAGSVGRWATSHRDVAAPTPRSL